MATTAQNNIVKAERVIPFAVLTDGTADINQGDMVYRDSSAKVAKSLGANDDTNAANLIGVAGDSSFINPYGTKLYQPSVQIPVVVSGIATFNTTAGDTYNEGDDLYVGADAQTVTNTVGGLTKKIGQAKMRPGQSAVAGGTGVTIDVIIRPKWPVDQI